MQTAVQVNIWCRKECQRRQFEIIKKVKPPVLFLVSDGGRNEQEWEAINSNRKMYDSEVDWPCVVHKLYEAENQGMYAMIKKTHEFVWSKVDRCIFLEDDILPSVSFFEYCDELLERYEDDKRISMICGMNHLGISTDVSSDYFFSRQGSIWGIATWKRFYKQFYDFDYKNDKYILSKLLDVSKKDNSFTRQFLGYANDSIFEGHPAAIEFFVNFSIYGQHQLQIIPKKNLISNIGCTGDSSHSDELKRLPLAVRKLFDMKIYEMEFPMKHPQYVIPDLKYEKKRDRLIGRNHPIVRLTRKVERAVYVLKDCDFDYLRKKVIKKICGEIEN